MPKRRMPWWLMLSAVLAVGTLAVVILRWGRVLAAPSGITVATAVAVGLWLQLGLYALRHRHWVRPATLVFLAPQLLLLVLALVLAVWGSLGGGAEARAAVGIGQYQLLLFLIDSWLMVAAFLVGMAGLRWLLTPGWPVFGVARTLIDEAARMRLLPLNLVVASLWISGLPLLLNDPHELLRYRLQTYLSQAMWGTSVWLSLMTIGLACWTVSAELSRRHIFLSMTKPVSRGQYLLGKWLGIMALNALLTAVCAMGIFGTTQQLAAEPARGREDRAEVVLQVLTARETISAVAPPDVDLAKLASDRLLRLQNEDPERYPKDKPFGARDLQANRNAVIDQYFSLTRLERKTYLFTGLEQARAQGGAIQLRFKPTGTQVDANLCVSLRMSYNGRVIGEIRPDPETRQPRRVALPGAVANGTFHVQHVPTDLIDEHGNLRVEITNINNENPNATVVGTISFDGGKDLMLLYRVGGFGPNLLRGMLLMYLRLGFLAMGGLVAGSLLPFAVACLVVAVVYVGASGSEFITESLQYYAVQAPDGLSLWQQMTWVLGTMWAKLADGAYFDAFKLFIRLFGQLFICLVPAFSRYDGATLLTEGRLISWGLVASALLWVGAIWTGSVALVGWLAFRRRELARITV